MFLLDWDYYFSQQQHRIFVFFSFSRSVTFFHSNKFVNVLRETFSQKLDGKKRLKVPAFEM